jgi:hypothetical protein
MILKDLINAIGKNREAVHRKVMSIKGSSFGSRLWKLFLLWSFWNAEKIKVRLLWCLTRRNIKLCKILHISTYKRFNILRSEELWENFVVHKNILISPTNKQSCSVKRHNMIPSAAFLPVPSQRYWAVNYASNWCEVSNPRINPIKQFSSCVLGWSGQIFLFEFQQRRGLKRRILVPKERI